MKKFLLSKKSMLMMAVVAVMAVACGLKITTVEFTTHEPGQGDELTVKATFMQEGDNNADNFYELFAVRVPSDWSAKGLKVVDKSAGGVDVEMIGCDAYAQFCEYCFPRDGYKWIAFQSKEARNQGGNSVAGVRLVAGQAMGDYTLDILAGGWKKDPAELVKDGQVNIELAFGNDLDFKKACTDADEATGKPATYFKSSEYLFIAGTISQAEYRARMEAMKASQTLTAYGMTMPIAPDIANVTNDVDMAVSVKEGAGIEDVAADAAEGAAEYFDLQGRKVANPEAGLYLVKRGDKIAKEIVK